MLRDFDDAEARAALPLKWGEVPDGTLPAWVAEMDWHTAPAVTDAVAAALHRGTTGYAPFGDPGVGAAFAGFAERQWGWRVPADAGVLVGGVVQGLAIALETLCPPGPVVLPLPCYPPFREVVALAGREAVHVETDPDDPVGALDLDAVERAFGAGARTLLLCHPHNPLGRVAPRAELEALRDLAAAHGARVVADEVHAPLALPDGPAFTPYLSLDPGAVVLTSATKSFNVPSLPCAQLLVLDPDEQARLRALPHAANLGLSALGEVAAVAAWSHGDAWLAAVRARIAGNRDLLADLLAEHLPLARTRRLEATYLAWLDLRGHTPPGAPDPAVLAERAGVRLGPGGDYHPGLPGHARLNLATTPARLAEVVRRLAGALEAG